MWFFSLVLSVILVLGRCRIILLLCLVCGVGVWLLCIFSWVMILLLGCVFSVVRLRVCVNCCVVVLLLLVRLILW